MTPIIVAFLSELLHRPTEKIAGRLASERAARVPGAADAGPAPEEEQRLPKRAPTGPPPEAPPSRPGELGPVRVYRSPPGELGPVRVYRSPPADRRMAFRVVAATGALAFVIAAVVLTVPELLAGESIAGGDRPTIIGGGKTPDGPEREQRQPATTGTTERRAPETDQDQQPEKETPAPEKEPARPAPQPGKTQPTPGNARPAPTTPPPPPQQAVPGTPVP